MKRFGKLVLICCILALSVGSYVYVHTDAIQSADFTVNQSGVEMSAPDVNEKDSQKLLPETRILEILADKVSGLFSSVIPNS